MKKLGFSTFLGRLLLVEPGGETPETLGPFSWAPRAMEMVTFGQQQGLAVASFADIEIWVKLTGWSKLSR